MKKLNKRFTSENETLHSFVTCSCSAAACNCDSMYNPANMSSSVAEQQDNAHTEQSRWWN